MSQQQSIPPIPFPETTYGVVKRVLVFYDWLNRIMGNGEPQDIKILDFGCGTGTLVAVPLASMGFQIHGVDSHDLSIHFARQRNASSNLSFSSESTVELIDRQFTCDVIICSEVLEHLEKPQKALDDFHTLLSPGGELFITVPNGYGS